MTFGTPAWVRDAIFYQVFPDRFASSDRVVKPGPLEAWDAPPTVHGFKGGDLLGLAERLDYLAELGVSAIYLNPIFSSASNHRYHTYDYLQVDPLLGGDAALHELLDAAHARGMRVVLDGVFNHASRGFWPFHHVLETGRDSPYREWFHLNQALLEGGRQLRAYPHEVLHVPLAPEWGVEHQSGAQSLGELGYRAWWDLPALPKLNTDNPIVREYLWQVAEHWIRFGADGWRLDVADEIEDPEFWREFRRRVRAVNSNTYLVGEVWRTAPEWLAGDRFDALMNYPLAWAIIGFAAGRHLDRAVAAEHAYVGAHLRSLDGPTFARQLTASLAAYPPEVVAAQFNLIGSHDTPRVRSLCGEDVTSVELAFLLLMSLPGAPCIYYGDEIGLSGRMDPACRGAFPWTEEGRWDGRLRSLVRELVAVRRRQRALRDGGFRVLGAEAGACAYVRTDGDAAFLIAVNAGETPAVLEGGDDLRAGIDLSSAIRVGPGPIDLVRANDGSARLYLAPRSGILVAAA